MGCMGARFSPSCSEKGIIPVAPERKVASNNPGPLLSLYVYIVGLIWFGISALTLFVVFDNTSGMHWKILLPNVKHVIKNKR